MQLCTNCGTNNPEGELFCTRCGVALGAISVATSQLGEGGDQFAAGSTTLSEDHIIFLHVSGFEDPLMLQVESQIILGRAGIHEGDAKGVNLEPFGASDYGVSRQHASLMRKDSQLYIRDLNSTNGTALNGQKLAAEREYALRDGDQITLGRLQFTIFFK